MKLTKELLKKYGICNSDIDSFIRSYPEGIDVDEIDFNKILNFIIYLAGTFLEITERYCREFDSIDARDYYNYTALMYASENGHFEIVELLLEHGANVNSKNKYGETALMIASQNDNLEIVKLLLYNGANISAINQAEWTALDFAKGNQHLEIIELLENYESNSLRGVDLELTDPIIQVENIL